MRRRVALIAIPLAAVATLGLMSVASAAPAGGSSTILTGGKEVPGPGDPNGLGRAAVRPEPLLSQLCVSIRYFGVEPPTGAHIHEAPAGVAGDIVVDFTPLIATSDPSYIEGCVPVDTVLARDIKKNPEDYYVNVHNAVYPAGAIRGQLR
jgi:hypothetical protein